MSQKKHRLGRYWLIWFVILGLVLLLSVLGLRLLLQQFNVWVIIGLGVLLYVLMAILQAKRNTSPQRIPIFYTDVKEVGFEYQEVTFPSRDGVELSGWFVPGQNGAGVIVTHGLSGNRLTGVKVARMLVKRGYSVLLYDLRLHGRSSGDVSTWGWLEVNDLLGALDYLLSRAEVNPERIGAFGYELGGQITLRAAAQDVQLRAIWAEGPTLAVLTDHMIDSGISFLKLVFYPWLWLAYQTQGLLTGVRMPEGVVQAVAKIAPRPLLLVAAGRGQEYLISRFLFETAGEPKELYTIAEARHGECMRARPEEYEKKLLGFFDSSLNNETALKN